jgi:hypothetical protein
MKKTYVKPELSKRGVLSAAATATSDSGQPVDSDIRLKTDIERVGTAANGLPIYDFKYIGGEDVYRGVMAQDVLERFPEAVCTMPSGYLGVRYDMLGMKMTKVH